MSNNKELETIYLALEEVEVLSDMGDTWSAEDTEEFGLDFQNLLELREHLVSRDLSKTLGFQNLLRDLFPEDCRGLLTKDEGEIWSSIESSLDYTIFAIAMSDLMAGNFDGIQEGIVENFLLEELADVEKEEEIRNRILTNFKSWKSSDKPEKLKRLLPSLASAEIEKLRYLRGSSIG